MGLTHISHGAHTQLMGLTHRAFMGSQDLMVFTHGSREALVITHMGSHCSWDQCFRDHTGLMWNIQLSWDHRVHSAHEDQCLWGYTGLMGIIVIMGSHQAHADHT